MRILLTGARGFIGSHVARLLVREGHDVYGVIRNGTRRPPTTEPLPGLLEVEVDLNDGAAVHEAVEAIRPECAIHLAWYAVPGKYWTAPENLNCVAMSLSLARALAESSCRRLVAAGSCAEYDWTHEILSEEATPTRPRTLYGVCKNAVRSTLEAYCADAAMEFAWARFFYLYGPGEPKQRLVPATILALLGGKTAECSPGEQMRDFLHVEDAAAAVRAVALSRVSGPINIGSGEPVRVRTLVETIAEILKCPAKVAFGTVPTVCGEPWKLVAEVRKLKTQTAWSPRFTLREGLENTVGWWQRMKALESQ